HQVELIQPVILLRFHSDEYNLRVQLNDYLDIFCPHYIRPADRASVEHYSLYLVNFDGYLACDHTSGFVRWECNKPYAASGPLKFSEKYLRFTPFSLGFEFLPGNEYYYISMPRHGEGKKCLRLKVIVCCGPNCCTSTCCGPSATSKMVLEQGPAARAKMKPKKSQEQADDSRTEASKAAHRSPAAPPSRPTVAFPLGLTMVLIAMFTA
uniref:Si:dkey-246i14.3 n=1 Tax=Eptatretus burgeri TaxID=7764 RepID=A0A8C4WYI7_EPTBU